MRYHLGAGCYGKTRHVRNVLNYIEKHNLVKYNDDRENDQQICNWFMSTLSQDDILKAHRAVCAGYGDGTYSRRGRPMYSKNRNKPDPQKDDFDALRDASEMLAAIEAKSNGQNAVPAAGVDISQLEVLFVKKAVFDNHDNSNVASFNAVSNKLAELNTRIAGIVENRPTIVELKQPNALPNIPVGLQHHNFPLLLQAVNSRLPNGHHINIWLFGPAGTGKTTAAEKIADIFFPGEPDKFHYNGALSTAFQLLGYMDAKGNYVSTAFRRAWEFGGVYLFDEIDGSMPDALLSMNGALANSIASFPDRMVPRHKDCIIMAGANTTGLGGGIEYVGAMKQNAAFLNRFVFIEWPHDNVLEDALCPNKEWLARVRQIRANWQRQQIKSHLITMRASI
ncbi:MAG: AAA family ATPase, partial [Anaerolineae bacterium]|nr:AAA family ATPase [Anaerolineae bacterium]